jgi:hypothetical protein
MIPSKKLKSDQQSGQTTIKQGRAQGRKIMSPKWPQISPQGSGKFQ